MNFEPKLRAAILAAPTDPTPRAIYADYLEDRGDPLAAGWRWLAETGALPKWWEDSLEGADEEDGAPYCSWWRGPDFVGGLPHTVFVSLRGYWNRGCDFCGYLGLMTALDAAAVAYTYSRAWQMHAEMEEKKRSKLARPRAQQ